ncbi:hypothetical protein E2C01_004470 [Portunus trituberculatus]|uniref:Uncharacterized protein n=1 Tax=Portunus trituberculatus TaxID=210409 RepID=A0A5B7CRG4_PORTR|nr:hypothetical protein [Portunus trituberculatus]
MLAPLRFLGQGKRKEGRHHHHRHQQEGMEGNLARFMKYGGTFITKFQNFWTSGWSSRRRNSNKTLIPGVFPPGPFQHVLPPFITPSHNTLGQNEATEATATLPGSNNPARGVRISSFSILRSVKYCIIKLTLRTLVGSETSLLHKDTTHSSRHSSSPSPPCHTHTTTPPTLEWLLSPPRLIYAPSPAPIPTSLLPACLGPLRVTELATPHVGVVAGQTVVPLLKVHHALAAILALHSSHLTARPSLRLLCGGPLMRSSPWYSPIREPEEALAPPWEGHDPWGGAPCQDRDRSASPPPRTPYPELASSYGGRPFLLPPPQLSGE